MLGPAANLTTMEVRAASDADVEALAALHVRSWQLGYAGLLPQHVLDGLEPAQRVPRWRTAVAAADLPRQGALVAGEAGELHGFVSIRPAPAEDLPPRPVVAGSVGQISSFYVEPSRWRNGVGRRLMSAALDNLRAAGYHHAILWVLQHNERAIAFYRAFDWRFDGSTKPDRVGDLAITDLGMAHPLD